MEVTTGPENKTAEQILDEVRTNWKVYQNHTHNADRLESYRNQNKGMRDDMHNSRMLASTAQINITKLLTPVRVEEATPTNRKEV